MKLRSKATVLSSILLLTLSQLASAADICNDNLKIEKSISASLILDQSIDGERLFAVSSGIGIGRTVSLSDAGVPRWVPESLLPNPMFSAFKRTAMMPAEIQVQIGVDSIDVPVKMSITRVGAFAEFMRAADEIKINFSHLSGRSIQQILGTYVGIDVSTTLVYGFYVGGAMNINGVRLQHVNLGSDSMMGATGAIGAGIAIPIIRIVPDYSRIPKGSSFWNRIIQ